MLPQTLNHNMYVERDHLNMCFKNVLIQLTVFNKDRHMAKSITFKGWEDGSGVITCAAPALHSQAKTQARKDV